MAVLALRRAALPPRRLAPRLRATAEAYAFLLPCLIVLAGLAAYPLLDGIATSLTDRAVARPGRFVGVANFVRLAQDPVYRGAVVHSLLLTAGAVGAKLVLGLAGAVLLSQRFPGRGLVRALAFLPWAVPGLVAGMSWRWLLDEQAGVINAALILNGLAPVDWLSDPDVAMVSIGVATVWQGLPFFLMMFVAGIAAIPAEQYEAAAIDGAGAWGRFRHVTLPGLADVVAITVMLSSIWTFNAFHTVYILTGGGPANRTQILPTLAYEYGLRRSELGLGAAVMTSVLPVFAVLILLLTRRMLGSRRP